MDNNNNNNVKKIVDGVLENVPLDELQHEVFKRTKKPVGRPRKETTKARKTYRIEARTIELAEVMGNILGVSQGDIVQDAVEYYIQHLRGNQVSPPSIKVSGQQLYRLDVIMNKSQAVYAAEIKAGRYK